MSPKSNANAIGSQPAQDSPVHYPFNADGPHLDGQVKAPAKTGSGNEVSAQGGKGNAANAVLGLIESIVKGIEKDNQVRLQVYRCIYAPCLNSSIIGSR